MSRSRTQLKVVASRSDVARSTGARGRRAPATFTIASDPIPSWREAKAALERWLLARALAECDGNMAAAGRRLGITKVAVLHAVRRHNINPVAPAPPGAA
jgi:transcriptional regulator with GAF, ATPase, and Fis domain